jgi:hypothetical protein
MYDNVKNVNNTYHIKKKRFSPCMGFLVKIYVSVFLIYVTDAECDISYFLALL